MFKSLVVVISLALHSLAAQLTGTLSLLSYNVAGLPGTYYSCLAMLRGLT